MWCVHVGVCDVWVCGVCWVLCVYTCSGRVVCGVCKNVVCV